MRDASPISGAYVDVDTLLSLRFRKPARTSENRRERIVGNRAGAKMSSIKGRGVELAEVRAYQPGDDVRSIDWRVTARTQKVHTKVFREERERPMLLVVDQTQNMFFGSRVRLKSVAAADLAARVAWRTLNDGDRVGGVVLTNEGTLNHRPRRSPKAVARLLNDIAGANAALKPGRETGHDLDASIMKVRRLARNNHRIVIVSDFAGPLSGWQTHLQDLARRNQVAAIHVYDALEMELPPADQYTVTDGAERITFYSGDDRVRARYRKAFESRARALEAMCRHESMSYRRVATDETHIDVGAWW